MRTNRNKTLNHLCRGVAVAFAAILAGCNSVNQEQSVDIGTPDVGLNIETRTIFDNTQSVSVSNVRIIAVSQRDGTIWFNKTTTSGDLVDTGTDPGVGRFVITLRPGHYKVYAVVNETPAMTTALAAADSDTDLAAIQVIGNRDVNSPSFTESNVALFGMCEMKLRAVGQEPTVVGELSTLNGTTWSGYSNTPLNLALDRIASKVSLNIRKQTVVPTDKFTITRVRIMNVPTYSYLIRDVYAETNHDEKITPNQQSGIEFTTNSTTYLPIFSGHIIPEYLPTSIADDQLAVFLNIEAVYNGQAVYYLFPIRENLSVADYSLKRNKHYIVNLTITKKGDYEYDPYIEYQIVDWSDASTNVDIDSGTITFTGGWLHNPIIDASGDVRVSYPGYLEYEFTLSHPEGVVWVATLSNGLDFRFDSTNGAVSAGRGRVGEVNKIRIYPNNPVSTNDIRTEFYITINNGVSTVEIDLNHSGSTGSGHRWIINQRAN